jgi:hypothetical protein
MEVLLYSVQEDLVEFCLNVWPFEHHSLVVRYELVLLILFLSFSFFLLLFC